MKKIIFYTLILSMAAYACNLPDGDIDLETGTQEFAVPLVNTTLDISDVTENSAGTTIEVNADGLVTVKYLGDVIRREVTEIFEVQDTTYPFPVVDGTKIPLPETAEGDIIDRIIFGPTSSTVLQHANVTSETVTATMTLPEFLRDGVPVEVSVVVEPGQTATSDTISLEGVEVTPSNDSIQLAFEVINASGNVVQTSPFSTVGALVNFDISYLEGLIVERVYPDLADEFIVVGLFENWISGSATFVDPKFTVDVVNGFGSPVSAIFNQMSITTVEGQTFDLESTLIDDGISVDYPSLDMVGQTTRTQFAFNKDNSNIEDLFGLRPERVTYDIDALVNPGSVEQDGFLDRSSFFQIDIAVEVPLEGRINDFVINADSELDLSSLDDVESGSFKVIFENSFPIDIDGQMYFVDDDGVVLDSLFEQGPTLLPSGQLDGQGDVTAATVTTLEIPFEADRLARIRAATQLDVDAKFASPDMPAGPLSIYGYNNLVIKMGARVILK